MREWLKMAPKSCDYLLKDDAFYFVKGYWNTSEEAQVTKVFVEARAGRYNWLTGKFYRKVVRDEIIEISDWDMVFDPMKNYENMKEKIPEAWKRFGEILEGYVGKSNVGITGSWLIGFRDGKDVDFVVYGKKARDLLHSKFDKFLEETGAKKIDEEEFNHFARKYSLFHNPKLNNYRVLAKRRWSCVKFFDGEHWVHTTIRFVYSKPEFPRNPYKGRSAGEIKVAGYAKEAWMSDFDPRMFYLEGSREYLVVVPWWSHQSCVKEGDFVEVAGELVVGGNYLSPRIVVKDHERHGVMVHEV